jgi:uncharacterized coiled-coil protein SlyX
MLQFAIVLIFLSAIFSCSSDSAKLKSENDSLRQQLSSSSKMIETMKTVNILLDSIDMTRHSVRLLSAEDKGGSDYSDRMTELKDYVKKTEGVIRELEASVAENSVNAETYMTIIDALKDELKIRNEEIGVIEDNDALSTAVNAKSTQLDDVEMKLESKRNELKLLQIQISELVRTAKITQADSYFAQAGAIEEAARRTKLAPNKKRDTYQEALELYQKALKLGKKEAKVKVDELKQKVD